MSDGARGDGPGTVVVVGAVLWLIGTLAVSAVFSHAVWLAETGGEADLAAIDWRPLWTTGLAWMAVLNLPVWIAGIVWWRRVRRGGNRPA